MTSFEKLSGIISNRAANSSDVSTNDKGWEKLVAEIFNTSGLEKSILNEKVPLISLLILSSNL